MTKKVFICKKTLHFRSPFQITYEKVTSAEILIVKIEDDKGNYGLGSAAPDYEVTGEKIDDIQQIISDKLKPSFFKFTISDWYRYHEKIQVQFAGFPSAQHAVEEALLNLYCHTNNLQLKNLFGGYRSVCETMVTIGIKNLAATIAEVRQRIKQGFRLIKLKIGLDLEEDIQKIYHVSKYIKHPIKLILDANQGYSLSDANKLLNKLADLDITLIEQPLPVQARDELKQLTKKSSIPIIADEAIVTVDDAYDLLLNNYVDGINVKLMKCGGPINFLKIFYLAKSLNKIIMIGCMYESNISITTGAHLALALPIDFVDLDSGYLDFADDPAIGGAEVKAGIIQITQPLKLNDHARS